MKLISMSNYILSPCLLFSCDYLSLNCIYHHHHLLFSSHLSSLSSSLFFSFSGVCRTALCTISPFEHCTHSTATLSPHQCVSCLSGWVNISSRDSFLRDKLSSLLQQFTSTQILCVRLQLQHQRSSGFLIYSANTNSILYPYL